MRQTTKRKLNGKANMCQSLRSAVANLVEAAQALIDVEPPALEAVRKALEDVGRVLENHDIYGVDRKRIRAAVDKVRAELSEILTKLVAIPITQDEKVLAKHKTGDENAHADKGDGGAAIQQPVSRLQGGKTDADTAGNRNAQALESDRGSGKRKAATARREPAPVSGRKVARRSKAKVSGKGKVGLSQPGGRKKAGVRQRAKPKRQPAKKRALSAA